MIGGLLKSTSSLAIVAAAGMFIGGLALTPAMAADLGGDCCADLEERVADLEATTARKGNRKVSLKITGFVSRTIGWYEDDFGSSEFYSAGNGPGGSRFQLTGSAKLTSTWTAGYSIRARLDSDRNSGALTQAGASAGYSRQNVAIDQNFVFLKNAQLGTVAFGQIYGPTAGVPTISLGGFGVAADAGGNDWNASSINGFSLERDSDSQGIAYISPTIAGFTLSAAWLDMNITSASVGGAGDDAATDLWEFALRYANEFGPIRIAGGIGYATYDNNETFGTASNVMGSFALMHTPTGLNVNFAAGTEIDGGIRHGNRGTGAYNPQTGTTDAQFWYVAGGINQNFFGMGKTSLYGEYGDYDYDNAAISDDTVTMWGLGIVQHFDSAATELFIAYRQWEQDVDLNANGVVDANTDGDVQQIMAGMRIKF